MDRRTYRIGSEGIEKEAGAAGDQRRSGEVYGEMGGEGEAEEGGLGEGEEMTDDRGEEKA